MNTGIFNVEQLDDTICAIATSPGMGGIAVIRVSGKDAFPIVAKCWKGTELESAKSHTAHYGRIIDTDGSILDEVVMTVFKAPHSFTGENVVEISCHGSTWIQQQLLNVLIANGCRIATGGEFTRRAFSHGKMDLSQAEAVADVIASSSRASHRIAMSQMRGSFSQKLNELRNRLLQFVSLMELELDFSEEEVEFADRSRMINLAEEISNVISKLANSFAVGNAIKNGVPVAIVGETNAGKSTLLNLLLGDDRAIVSDIHGTTRDVIEDTITINGTLFRFIDTAGIRDTSDTIEALGIERTFKKLNEASIVLWVVDGNTSVKEISELGKQILPLCIDKNLVIIVNKEDVMQPGHRNDIKNALDMLTTDKAHLIFMSAKHHTGLDQLLSLLNEAAALPENDGNEVIVTNARHYEALLKANEAIKRAIDGLTQGISGDFISQDIRECMHYLGEITGEITTDDILGEIFSHFCIGK